MPMATGPRSSQTSSTRFALRKDDATRAPPSTISRVMPRSASVFRTDFRSRPGVAPSVTGTRITCAPAAPSFIAAGASAKSDAMTHNGVCRAE